MQEHTAVQAVEVETGHDGLFDIDCCLFIDNGCQGGDLDGSKSLGCGFGFPLGSPIGCILFFKALEKFLHRDVPIHFVGVGDEKGRQGRIAISRTVGQHGCPESVGQFFLSQHQLPGDGLGQPLNGTHTGQDQADGRLPSHIETAHGGA